MAGLTNLFGGGDDRDDDQDDVGIGVDGSADDAEPGADASGDTGSESEGMLGHDIGGDSLLGGDAGAADQADEASS